MRADQLVNLLDRLKLKPASKRAAEALGLSVRQLQRLTAGRVPVPKPVALLAIAYTKLGGVPDPLWNEDADKTDALQEITRRLLASRKYQPEAPEPAPATTPELPTIVVSRGAPLPTAPQIEAAPEPPPIRSTTRRRQPAPLTPAQIKWRADRAQTRSEGKPVEAPYPELSKRGQP